VTVLIRPEQFALSSLASSSVVPAGEVTGTMTWARYHGHDALISVDVTEAGVLQARVLGTEPPADGDEVSLTVRGPVTAWAAPPAEAAGSPGPGNAENA
jgi:iron(III) transport system ATP-binding protein